MRIYLYEDTGVHNLQPLSLTRPAFDLRCGALSLRERQERILPGPATDALVRPDLADLCRLHHPHLRVNDTETNERGPVLLVNARWLATATDRIVPERSEIGVIGEQIAYAVVPAEELRDLSFDNLSWRLAEWQRTLPQRPAGGRMIDYPWDLIENNAAALADDYTHWWKAGVPEASNVTVTGPPSAAWPPTPPTSSRWFTSIPRTARC